MKSTLRAMLTRGPWRRTGKSFRNLFFPRRLTEELRRSFSVEISSVCNARCVFCNYRLGLRRRSTMTPEMFERTVRSFRALGYRGLSVTSMGGDPFTHAQAVPMIEKATELGCGPIEIYSNGIDLGKHDLERLLRLPVERLHLSFPGVEPEVYRQVFGVDRCGDFIRSLQRLLTLHRDLRSTLTIVLEPRSPCSIAQIRSSEFGRRHLEPYLGERVRFAEPMVFFDDWCGTVKPSDLPAGMRLEKNPLKSIWPLKKVHLCSHMVVPGISAGGSVRLCNCRYDGSIETEGDELFLGQVGEEDLRAFFAARRERVLRLYRSFRRGRLPSFCRRCPTYLPLAVEEAEVEKFLFLEPTGPGAA
jgi:hypothetical protein